MTETRTDIDVHADPQKPIRRRRGWEPFAALRDELDTLFDVFAPRGWAGIAPGRTEEGQERMRPLPSLDLTETERAYELTMDLPGMKQDEITIKMSDNILSISGEMRRSVEDKGKTYIHTERRSGSFHRAINLPPNADEAAVTAEFANGVLTVTIPKAEDAHSAERKIEIKAG